MVFKWITMIYITRITSKHIFHKVNIVRSGSLSFTINSITTKIMFLIEFITQETLRFKLLNGKIVKRNCLEPIMFCDKRKTCVKSIFTEFNHVVYISLICYTTTNFLIAKNQNLKVFTTKSRKLCKSYNAINHMNNSIRKTFNSRNKSLFVRIGKRNPKTINELLIIKLAQKRKIFHEVLLINSDIGNQMKILGLAKQRNEVGIFQYISAAIGTLCPFGKSFKKLRVKSVRVLAITGAILVAESTAHIAFVCNLNVHIFWTVSLKKSEVIFTNLCSANEV